MSAINLQPQCWIITDGMESPHGTEVFTALLAQELVARGWHVEMWLARHKRSASVWDGFLRRLGIRLHHPHFWFMTRWNWPFRLVTRMLWRAHAKRAPDVTGLPATIFSPRTRCSHAARTPFFVHDPSEAGPQCPHYHPDWFRACHLVPAMCCTSPPLRCSPRSIAVPTRRRQSLSSPESRIFSPAGCCFTRCWKSWGFLPQLESTP